MKITIHNVGHGLCVSLIHENGNVMLWDCGHSDTNRPSNFLRQQGVSEIDILVVTNYDEDHISDLPNLRHEFNINRLHRNKSISADELRQLKHQSGPITTAMEHMLYMVKTYTKTSQNQLKFPRVSYKVFCNSYKSDFVDTNNISLVTFLNFHETCLLIPGDLEIAGWQKLLEDEGFRHELKAVNYLIASHHGREDGYCKEVFDYCKPKAVIFSDSEIKYATQQMAGVYSEHASGCKFKGETRYVLSTRKDGDISWG